MCTTDLTAHHMPDPKVMNFRYTSSEFGLIRTYTLLIITDVGCYNPPTLRLDVPVKSKTIFGFNPRAMLRVWRWLLLVLEVAPTVLFGVSLSPA